MQLMISRDWARRFDQVDDSETEAGSPVNVREATPISVKHLDAISSEPVFGLFVRQLRRRHGLTVHQMASLSSLTEGELQLIERVPGHVPDGPAMRRLAEVAGIREEVLARLSNVGRTPEAHFQKAAFTFIARSEQASTLTSEEQEAFDEYLQYLKSSSGEDEQKLQQRG